MIGKIQSFACQHEFEMRSIYPCENDIIEKCDKCGKERRGSLEAVK